MLSLQTFYKNALHCCNNEIKLARQGYILNQLTFFFKSFLINFNLDWIYFPSLKKIYTNSYPKLALRNCSMHSCQTGYCDTLFCRIVISSYSECNNQSQYMEMFEHITLVLKSFAASSTQSYFKILLLVYKELSCLAPQNIYDLLSVYTKTLNLSDHQVQLF